MGYIKITTIPDSLSNLSKSDDFFKGFNLSSFSDQIWTVESLKPALNVAESSEISEQHTLKAKPLPFRKTFLSF